MSNNSDFIEAWNDTIPFKIKEIDLSKPTETFLLNALANYLFMLNIDVSSRMNVEGNELRRLEKIKLCHYINHLYKLSDDSNNFYYMDLVHPPVKKTAHLLKHLLNYFHYYNMVKNEVIEGAASVINKYQSMLSQRNQQEIENEENKIKLHNMEIKLKERMAILPDLQETFRQYEAKKESVDSKLIDLETKYKNSEYTIDQCKNQINKAKGEMVLESEMKYLLEQIAALDMQIEEYTAMEVAGRENNQTIANAIPALEEFNRKLEEIIEILNSILQMDDSKELTDQLVNQIATENKKKSEKEKQIIDTEKLITNTEIDYKKEIDRKMIELKKLLDAIPERSKQLKSIMIEEEKYTKQSADLEATVQDLQSQYDRIVNIIENSFKILTLNEVMK